MTRLSGSGWIVEVVEVGHFHYVKFSQLEYRWKCGGVVGILPFVDAVPAARTSNRGLGRKSRVSNAS